MNLNIEPDSVKKENGFWTPVANIYLHSGNLTEDRRWVWENKAYKDKNRADFIAKFLATRYLIKIGVLAN